MSPLKASDILEPIKDKIGVFHVRPTSVITFRQAVNRWRSTITGRFLSTKEALSALGTIMDENGIRRIMHVHQADRDRAIKILGDYKQGKIGMTIEELKEYRERIFGFDT